MDRITKDYIEKFLSMYEIESEDINKDFEKFAAYCVLRKDYSKTVSVDQIEDIVVASPGDMGIDGVAIIVDDELITETDKIDELIEKKDELRVIFIFVQVKNTNQFDRTEFRDFTGGVREFFNDYLEKPTTRTPSSKIKQKIKLATHLLKTSLMISSQRPICKLYYLTTESQVNLSSTKENLIESERREIENTNLFENVEIKTQGIKYIQNLYRSTLSKPKVSINFIQKTPLPSINGIKEAYIGVLPFSEFRKIIVDDSDNIKVSVFEENVRYFNKNYSINQDIKRTIQEGKIDRFVVLNNGITIVAKVVKPVGSVLVLEDYQIVNGCQTSHVLYESRNVLGIDDLYVTVKIIHTKDQDIINSVITATNNQTPVKLEALSSLLSFQKLLESLYNTYKIPQKEGVREGNKENRLYYERQEGQYTAKDISQSKVISISIQAKSVAAMFLEVPHQSAREYGKIKQKIGSDIFLENHETIPYYTSALAHYEVYKILRSKTQNFNKYSKFRFHILMIIKYLIVKQEIPSLSNKKINEYCNKIIKTLDSSLDDRKKEKLLSLVKTSIEIIESAASKWAKEANTDDPIDAPDITQRVNFTNCLKREIEDYLSASL
jgi:hypothetical protein